MSIAAMRGISVAGVKKCANKRLMVAGPANPAKPRTKPAIAAAPANASRCEVLLRSNSSKALELSLVSFRFERCSYNGRELFYPSGVLSGRRV